MNFQKNILELIRQVSTNLPADVAEALVQARNQEEKNSRGELSLDVVLKNIALAKKKEVPICQDTGFPTFFVSLGDYSKQAEIREAILAAVRQATKEGLLRPNAVDPISGKNSDDNVGDGCPAIYFKSPSNSPFIHSASLRTGKGENVEVSLLLKGGGSENVSDQVALPIETEFGLAERSLEGVKKAVLQIVKNAQGKGCAPGMISVVIGSDRTGGYTLAKKNLLQKIGTENSNLELAQLETEILKEANELGIGPMGLGGKTTLLDCKLAVSHRIPASYFVTVAYSCWATRRGSITLDKDGEIIDDTLASEKASESLTETLTRDLDGLPNVRHLNFPLDEKEVRDLKVGDMVLLSGKIFTGRDRVHEIALRQKLPCDLKDSAIYHCGPIAVKENEKWKFLSAGPTTSNRMENYTAEFIEKTGIRAIIGKGGMGEQTAEALKKRGAVYLHAIGGAAAFYADTVKKIHSVNFLEEFGIPEAMWEIEVEDFLAVVTMDAGGNVKLI